jgi:tight adherence protein B
VTAAALALALAVVVLPSSPTRRLMARRTSHRFGLPPVPCAIAVTTVAAIALPMTTVLAAVIVTTTVWWRVRRRSLRSRKATESHALAAALDVLVGELRAGAHPVAAFNAAASEAQGPVTASLGAVAARARLGADVPAGLRAVASGSSVPSQWERLAVCWQLAQTHGLAMATLMRAAQRDIVERTRFSARVSAGMAGARATAAVLAGLPVLGIGLGQLLGANPLAFLLSGGVGGVLLVIGVTLGCVGLLWSDRITGRVS